MNEIHKGASDVEEKECLSVLNFNEIKNLVKYITEGVVPLFERLERKVEELTEKICVLEETKRKRKSKPLFNLELDDDEFE